MVLTFSGANVNQTAATNRTLWPLTGGSLSLDLHHPWTYLFVNLGLGTVYPTFNITLTNQLLNETGNGTLCLPQVVLPSSFTPSDGQNASIQVVTVGASGSALYNVSDPSIRYASPMSSSQPSLCSHSLLFGTGVERDRGRFDLTDIETQCADITFSSNATTLSGDRCTNSSNVKISVVDGTTTTTLAANSSSTHSAASGKSSELMTAAGIAVVLGGIFASLLI
jgi:hypothetical protein